MPRAALLATIVAALVATGCSVDADLSGGNFLCDDGRGCPPGSTCVGGVCVRPADAAPPDGAIAADAASADAPTVDAAAVDASADATPLPDAGICGEATLLTDDFEDGVAAATWAPYSAMFTSLTEAGGLLVVSPASNKSGMRYAGYLSVATYRLRGSRVWVAVPTATNTATTAQTRLMAVAPGGDRLALIEESGQLRAESFLGGITTTIGMVAYSAVAHRFWQIREDAGTVYWEASPDGLAWTTIASTPTPALVDAVQLDVSAGTYTSEPTPGTGEFDDFNGGGAPIGTPCP